MRAGFAILFLVVLAALLSWWSSGGVARNEMRGLGHEAGVLSDSSDAAALESGSVRSSDSNEVAATPLIDEDREAVLSAPLSGWVVGSGQPVAGATITWTPLSAELVQKGTPWSDKDWHRVVRSTHRATSTSDGHFSLAVKSSEKAAIWITHPSFEAAWRVLEPEEDAGRSIDVQLDPSDGVRVRVVDESGLALAGVSVTQYGQPGLWADGAGGATAVLHRSTTSDINGYADLAPLPASSVSVATDSGLASRPLEGAFRGSCDLVLGNTFGVSGIVRGEGFSVEEPATVTCFLIEGPFSRALGRMGVASDGSFGPLSVPLVEHSDYRFYLEGGNAQPAHAHLGVAPEPGESAWIEFEAELGDPVWAAPEAVDGTPLLDAEVSISWLGEGRAREAMTARPFQKGHPYEGYVLFLGVPRTSVALSATCDGYSPVRGSPFKVPEENTSSRVLTLNRGATVTGRCLYKGEPVEDFEILYWPGVTASAIARKAFFGRKDGSFAIRSAPAGAVQLMAVARDYPRSEAIGLEVPPGGSAEVTLELLDPVTCRGRVLDQVTGVPISDARVQLWTNHMNSLIATRGEPAATSSQGEFELTGLVAGPNTIEFHADGYSSFMLSAVADHRGVALGDIALVPAQSLEVRLYAEAGTDYAGYSVDIHSQRAVQGLLFSPDGTCRVENMGAGRAFVSLREPSGQGHHLATYLHPGLPGLVEFHLAGLGSRVALQTAIDGRASAPDQPMSGRVTFRDEAGETRYVSKPFDAEGRAVFEGIPPGPVEVAAWQRGAIVSSRVGLVEADTTATFSLDLAGRTTAIRVLDSGGDPLSGVAVGLLGPGQIEGWYRVTTDSSGLATFAGTTPGPYLVHIRHPILGQRTDIPIQISADQNDPIDVGFDDAITFSLLVDSAGLPVAGANCELYSSGGDLYVSKRLTNADGIATWTNIGAGSYLLGVRHGNYSFASALVEARENPDDPLRVSLRPLGAIEFSVTRDGSPAEGLSVQLIDRESGESAAQWLRRRLVVSSTGSVSVDGDGELRLDRLPTGTYDWKIGGAQGTATIEPGEATTVSAYLQ